MTPPHPSALAPDDLERLTGYQQQADIEKWCQKNGIRVFRSRAGVWTTLEAVNAALGLGRAGERPPVPLDLIVASNPCTERVPSR